MSNSQCFLDLSVSEFLRFEEVKQNFSLFMSLVELPKAPEAEIASNKVF